MPTVIAGPPVAESTQLLREVIISAHGTKQVADFLGVDREVVVRWTHGTVPKRYVPKLHRLRKITGPPGRSQDPGFTEDTGFSIAL